MRYLNSQLYFQDAFTSNQVFHWLNLSPTSKVPIISISNLCLRLLRFSSTVSSFLSVASPINLFRTTHIQQSVSLMTIEANCAIQVFHSVTFLTPSVGERVGGRLVILLSFCALCSSSFFVAVFFFRLMSSLWLFLFLSARPRMGKIDSNRTAAMPPRMSGEKLKLLAPTSVP